MDGIMKKIVVIRHGQYDVVSGNLTKQGEGQIENLARSLRQKLLGKTFILTSPAPRTRQTANLLGELLHAEIQEQPILWSGGDAPPQTCFDPPAVLEFIVSLQQQVENVMVVTHWEYVETLPRLLSKKFLERPTALRSLARGEAWMIDLESQTTDVVD